MSENLTEDHDKYTVTFDSKGGTAVEPQTVNWGEKAIKPVDPLLEGHSFEGWYKDIDYSSLYNFDTPVKNDITLFGKWKVNTYVVNFDSDGGTAVAPQIVKFAEKAIEPENPTKEGYTFKGWYEEKSNKPYDFNTPVKSNVNLKAHWEINKYTVTFDSDGGTAVDPQTVSWGEKATKPENPTKEGYTFKGWFEENSKEPYDFNTAVKSDVNLKAHWEINKYTVTFDSDGGTAVEPQTVNWGEKAKEPENPVKEGYTFKGWYEKGADKAFDFNTEIKSDVNLKAHWEINKYTVTFDSDGGTAVEPQTVSWGEKATKPENPTKEGYTFKGWFEENSKEPYDFNTAVKSDVNLKAHWEINKYTVTFDSDGGTAVEPQTVNWGEKAKEPENPVKEGYTFKGWYEKGADKAFDFNTEIKSDVNLKAHWEKIPETVTPGNTDNIEPGVPETKPETDAKKGDKPSTGDTAQGVELMTLISLIAGLVFAILLRKKAE